MRIDCHLHTYHSFDGKSDIQSICHAAWQMGMDYICFTEHFSVCAFDPSYHVLDYDVYSRDIEEARTLYQGKIIIGKGLEVGEPHVEKETVDAYMMDKGLDLVIGSIHNVGEQKLRRFMAGKMKEEIYGSYFKTLLEMITHGSMDVIGHFDLMKRYACTYAGNYELAHYQEVVEQILQKAIQRGIGIEINTSGISQEIGETFPTVELLKRYRQMGGEIVTVGSDGHSAEQVGRYIDIGCQLLREAGFTYQCMYEKRKPVFVRI